MSAPLHRFAQVMRRDGVPAGSAGVVAARRGRCFLGVRRLCGYLSPGGEAVFSVAIRTAIIDRDSGTGELSVGSGITWDSRQEDEYAECLAKGDFARSSRPVFRIVETLLWEDGAYFLRERHLARLFRSAGHLCFSLDMACAESLLAKTAATLAGSHKVRLLLAENGEMTADSSPVVPDPEGGMIFTAIANATVDSRDPLLYHKTTHRPLYHDALAARPDCIDLIFVNERGEVAEGGNHNVVARIGGELVTPPAASGLLSGVFREELLAAGVIRERVITREELARAEELFLVNSVRRWRRVRLID